MTRLAGFYTQRRCNGGLKRQYQLTKTPSSPFSRFGQQGLASMLCSICVFVWLIFWCVWSRTLLDEAIASSSPVDTELGLVWSAEDVGWQHLPRCLGDLCLLHGNRVGQKGDEDDGGVEEFHLSSSFQPLATARCRRTPKWKSLPGSRPGGPGCRPASSGEEP